MAGDALGLRREAVSSGEEDANEDANKDPTTTSSVLVTGFA